MSVDVFKRRFTELRGESLVAAELTKQGYLPLLTPRNFPATDIVAFNPRNRHTIPIQIKTRNEGTDFPMGRGLKKHPTKILYVFVRVSGNDCQEFFVVPGRQINGLLKKHRKRYKAEHPSGRANPEKQLWTLDAERELRPYRNAWRHLKNFSVHQ